MSESVVLPAPAPDEMAILRLLSGSPLSPQRLAELLAAYEPILAEIARLRTLDLRDVHPAVIFEPTAVYREHP